MNGRVLGGLLLLAAGCAPADVYVQHWCGARCGDQHWALLARTPDGRWALRRMLLTAIS